MRNIINDGVKLCSGHGQFHTNEADPKKPDKILIPYENISWGEIKLLIDNPQTVEKSQAQWLIPSLLPSRNFKEQEANGEYWLLWADLDKNPKLITQVKDALIRSIGDADFEIYTTSSATKENPKSRILIPLSESLNGFQWKLCQEILNDKLGRA
mgnify:FL=1